MADRETVITHLMIVHIWSEFALEQDLNFFTKKHLKSISDWTSEALELLKEQKQKQVILHGVDEWYGPVLECPDCKAEWMSDEENTHYCPNCGRAVERCGCEN